MAKMTFENPGSPAGFLAVLMAQNVELPLQPSEHEAGVLLDAQGRDVITIDVNGARPDEEVVALTAYICMAVNQAGGFKVLRAECTDLEPTP